MPLRQKLRHRLKIPVVVESDRNCAVLGERWRGAARGQSDVVVLIVGTGIGAGIMAGGRIVRGAHELSGCAGWMAITEDDCELFRQTGTLEALASGPAIARNSATNRSTLELAEAARTGDAEAAKLFSKAGRRLGIAVANIISMFDPAVVIVSGGLAGAADLFFDELQRTAIARAQPLAARQVKIRTSRLANNANLIGAAKLAFLLGPIPPMLRERNPRPLR
jgi:predicted NBD/HSP70 family sugar kinase